MLSIVIPVYNEEPTVHRILEKIRDVQLSVRKEIILVDDGSTDRSFERVKQWIAENPLPEGDRIFQISKANGGKGSAFREGCRVSSGDVVIIQDADLEYSPDDYVKCITPILNGDAKVVYGSRELFSKNRRLHSSLMYYFG